MADILKHEASAGKTILVITHDAEFIDACCRYRIGLCREPSAALQIFRKHFCPFHLCAIPAILRNG
jgi:ATPase subunit of ABC transporter with duplicated ATPase domains